MPRPTESESQLLAKHGIHKFLAGPKPDGASKHQHYPCRTCGLSKKNRIHRVPSEGPAAVADDKNVAVHCPTCEGKGTLLIPVAEIQKWAARRRS